MNMDYYQEKAHDTAVYPREVSLEYLTLGLVGEAGEIANKVKKILRGDTPVNKLEDAIKDELGDVLWYLAELANELGVCLSYIAISNLEKLHHRSEKGTIKGSGDNR